MDSYGFAINITVSWALQLWCRHVDMLGGSLIPSKKDLSICMATIHPAGLSYPLNYGDSMGFNEI